MMLAYMSQIASAVENNTSTFISPPQPLPGRVNDVRFIIIIDEPLPLKPFVNEAVPSETRH